jgi:hypothetical protein
VCQDKSGRLGGVAGSVVLYVTHRASFDNILTSSLSWLEFWYGGLFLLTSKGVVGSFKKKKKKKDMHSPVALIIENMSV